MNQNFRMLEHTSSEPKKTMKLAFFLSIFLCFFSACKQEKPTPVSNQERTEKKVSFTETKGSGDRVKTIFKTSTGKSIELITDKKSNSLSDLKIVPLDFIHTQDTFHINDSDPLQHAWIKDLDGNGFDELYLITTSSGSGSYATIYGFASNQDLSMTPIYVPEISEKDLLPEGVYYGYMGHDSIYVDHNKIHRKFPVYKKGDANCCPSGGGKTLSYELHPGETSWILRIEKYSPNT